MATTCVERDNINPDKQPSLFCETCEYKRTTKYCTNCELSFCVTCIKVHQKMKGSQDHVVCEYSEPESTYEGKQLEPQLPCCYEHPGNDYKLFCIQCTCLICEKCKPAHNGHSMEVISKDFGFYRNVCRKNTQRLQDTAHELEDYKLMLERNAKNCDEAIAHVERWELELVELVRKCALELKETLVTIKEGYEKNTEKQQPTIDDMLDEIDNQVANLNTRKLDQQIIAHQTASSQALLSKATNMTQTLPSQPKVIPATDLLPRCSEMECVRDRIKQLFDTTHTSLCDIGKLIGEFIIPNPKSCDSDSYQLCKPSLGDSVIMHGSSMANLRIHNRTSKVMSEDKSDRHIWNMIALSSGKYVSIHGFSKSLFLLKNNFQSTFKTSSKEGFYFAALYPVLSDSFLAYEIKETFPSKGFLRVIDISGNQFANERQFQLNVHALRGGTCMTMLSDHIHALICCKNEIHKVDIVSGNYKTYDLSVCAKSTVEVYCITTDSDDNILVGCKCKTVHLFDKKFQTHKVFLKVEHVLGDIEVVGNSLFVSTFDKLYEYLYA